MIDVFRLIVVPIAVRMGIPNKKKKPLDSNKALEQAFLTSRNPDEKMLKVGFDFLSGLKIIIDYFQSNHVLWVLKHFEHPSHVFRLIA